MAAKVRFEDIERDLAAAKARQVKSAELTGKLEGKLSKALSGAPLADMAIDLSDTDFTAVRANETAFEANLATLIFGLDEVTKAFGDEFRDMSQSTTSEKVMGFLSKRKAAEMRSDRVRHTDIRGNLTALIAKSQTISSILTEQLAVLEDRLTKNIEAQGSVLAQSKVAAGEMARLEGLLDSIAPRIAAIDDKLADSIGEARKDLEAQRAGLANEHNEAQSQLQAKTAEQQSLERYASQYANYIESLTRQKAAQQTMIAKLRIDTEQRTILYDTLVESLRTTQQQDIAHRIDDIGSETDAQAEEMMLQGGVSAQNRIASMMEAHAAFMSRSKAVTEKGRIAQDAFVRRFAKVMEGVNTGRYTEGGGEA